MFGTVSNTFRWILILAMLVYLFDLRLAQAAPRAQSGAECQAFADMAIVARALAQGKIAPAASAAIMATIYTLAEPRHAEMMAEIVRAAERDPRPPGEFATAFLMACAEGRGNVDGFLGVRL